MIIWHAYQNTTSPPVNFGFLATSVAGCADSRNLRSGSESRAREKARATSHSAASKAASDGASDPLVGTPSGILYVIATATSGMSSATSASMQADTPWSASSLRTTPRRCWNFLSLGNETDAATPSASSDALARFR